MQPLVLALGPHYTLVLLAALSYLSERTYMHTQFLQVLAVQRRPHCAAYLAGADPHEVARFRDVDRPTCCEGTINCT